MFLSQNLNPDKEQAEGDTEDKIEAIVEEKQGETAKKGNLKYIVDVTVAYPEGKI